MADEKERAEGSEPTPYEKLGLDGTLEEVADRVYQKLLTRRPPETVSMAHAYFTIARALNTWAEARQDEFFNEDDAALMKTWEWLLSVNVQQPAAEPPEAENRDMDIILRILEDIRLWIAEGRRRG